MTADVTELRRKAAGLSQSSFRLVLGSQSPRRRSLLADDGYRFAVLPSRDGVEEQLDVAGLEPLEYVRRLASGKARDVASQLCGKVSQGRWNVDPSFSASSAAPPYLVLACDSVAVCKGEILGKPADRADAERMLRALDGSRHEVDTGLALWRVDFEDYESGPKASKLVERAEVSVLEMDKLTEEQLQGYLESGLWEGKAGAFGYQDGNDWLTLFSGSESNVVGLPLEALAETLISLFPETL